MDDPTRVPPDPDPPVPPDPDPSITVLPDVSAIWRVTPGSTPSPEAVAAFEQRQRDRIAGVTKWGIFKYFEFWGWVELTAEGLVTGGPFPDKVNNLMDSMRGNRPGPKLSDAELFASLPMRLTGVIHVGPHDYKPEDHPEHKFD